MCFGIPGWRRERFIKTYDNIFSKPSWMSFLSCGIWVASSRKDAVNAGLKFKICFIKQSTINILRNHNYAYRKVKRYIIFHKDKICNFKKHKDLKKFNYLKPVAIIGSNKSLISFIIVWPTACANILIQVNTAGSIWETFFLKQKKKGNKIIRILIINSTKLQFFNFYSEYRNKKMHL